MAGIRPPLFSQGQTDDAAAYIGMGTGLMWLAGGLAAGPAMAVLGLCGLGVALNHSRIGDDAPTLKYNPEQPPARPQLPPAQAETQQQYEDELQAEFGSNAVYCFRTMIAEAKASGEYDRYIPLVPLFEKLRSLLRELRERGLWKDGRLQAEPGETPEDRLLRDIEDHRQRNLKTARNELDILNANIGAYIEKIGIVPPRTDLPDEHFEDEFKDDVEAVGLEKPVNPSEFLLPPSGLPQDIANETRLMQSYLAEGDRRDIACYIYRKLRQEGHGPDEAYELASRSMTQNAGMIDQHAALVNQFREDAVSLPLPDGITITPRLDSDFHVNQDGYSCASPDLMRYMNPHRVVQYAAERMTPQERAETNPRKGYGAALRMASCIAYILGAPAVTDPPVRKIVWWPEYELDGRNDKPDPLYFVLGDQWYVLGAVRTEFYERYMTVVDCLVPPDRPDLRQEAEDLFVYRVEVYHHPEAPPGHPGFSWKRVLFGGTERVGPATLDDMRGRP